MRRELEKYDCSRSVSGLGKLTADLIIQEARKSAFLRLCEVETVSRGLKTEILPCMIAQSEVLSIQY